MTRSLDGPAPHWMVLGIFAFSCFMLAYCLWTGKAGGPSGTVSTRADDPFDYWLKMLLLVGFIFLMYRAAFHHLPA